MTNQTVILFPTRLRLMAVQVEVPEEAAVEAAVAEAAQAQLLAQRRQHPLAQQLKEQEKVVAQLVDLAGEQEELAVQVREQAELKEQQQGEEEQEEEPLPVKRLALPGRKLRQCLRASLLI